MLEIILIIVFGPIAAYIVLVLGVSILVSVLKVFGYLCMAIEYTLNHPILAAKNVWKFFK